MIFVDHNNCFNSLEITCNKIAVYNNIIIMLIENKMNSHNILLILVYVTVILNFV